MSTQPDPIGDPRDALQDVIDRGTYPDGTPSARVVPLALLERLRDAFDELENPPPGDEHIHTVIDCAELELREYLAARDDVEVLALMRFAVILDRGIPLLACAAAPLPENVAKMGEHAAELARGLRGVADAIDPQ